MVVIAGCHAAIGVGHSCSWHRVAVWVRHRVGKLVGAVASETQALAVEIPEWAFVRKDSWLLNAGVGNSNNNFP